MNGKRKMLQHQTDFAGMVPDSFRERTPSLSRARSSPASRSVPSSRGLPSCSRSRPRMNADDRALSRRHYRPPVMRIRVASIERVHREPELLLLFGVGGSPFGLAVVPGLRRRRRISLDRCRVAGHAAADLLRLDEVVEPGDRSDLEHEAPLHGPRDRALPHRSARARAVPPRPPPCATPVPRCQRTPGGGPTAPRACLGPGSSCRKPRESDDLHP